MLPGRIPRRLRGEFVRKGSSPRAVTRFEDLVRDASILQKLGGAQACDASADDSNAVPRRIYGLLGRKPGLLRRSRIPDTRRATVQAIPVVVE